MFQHMADVVVKRTGRGSGVADGHHSLLTKILSRPAWLASQP
jgi:hypothetical protein